MIVAFGAIRAMATFVKNSTTIVAIGIPEAIPLGISKVALFANTADEFDSTVWFLIRARFEY